MFLYISEASRFDSLILFYNSFWDFSIVVIFIIFSTLSSLDLLYSRRSLSYSYSFSLSLLGRLVFYIFLVFAI